MCNWFWKIALLAPFLHPHHQKFEYTLEFGPIMVWKIQPEIKKGSEDTIWKCLILEHIFRKHLSLNVFIVISLNVQICLFDELLIYSSYNTKCGMESWFHIYYIFINYRIVIPCYSCCYRFYLNHNRELILSWISSMNSIHG
jgi:hypothetical protein